MLCSPLPLRDLYKASKTGSFQPLDSFALPFPRDFRILPFFILLPCRFSVLNILDVRGLFSPSFRHLSLAEASLFPVFWWASRRPTVLVCGALQGTQKSLEALQRKRGPAFSLVCPPLPVSFSTTTQLAFPGPSHFRPRASLPFFPFSLFLRKSKAQAMSFVPDLGWCFGPNGPPSLRLFGF